MTKWYARGEMGEFVLDVVESAVDNVINQDQFIAKLREAGLDDQEIMDVYAGEVLGV
jgi:hypothetical protein